MNSFIPSEEGHNIFRHDTPTCRECCAAVRNKDADLARYTRSDLPSVRVLLAMSAGTPLAVLSMLATDPHPAVRKALRGNSSIRGEHAILHALDAADETKGAEDFISA